MDKDVGLDNLEDRFPRLGAGHVNDIFPSRSYDRFVVFTIRGPDWCSEQFIVFKLKLFDI